MVRAVAFDFDGVIVESVDVKTQAFARIFADAGPAIVEKVVTYHLENGGVSRVEKFRHFYRHYLKQQLPDSELETLCDRFRTLVFEDVIAAPWVPGALESVKRFYADGLPQFIVSGTPGDELEQIVTQREIRQYFDGVFGSPRQKADLLQWILSANGLAPSEVLFIGDAMTDYEGARISGVRFVARSTSEDFTRWRALGVSFLQDLSELPSFMAGLEGFSGKQEPRG